VSNSRTPENTNYCGYKKGSSYCLFDSTTGTTLAKRKPFMATSKVVKLAASSNVAVSGDADTLAARLRQRRSLMTAAELSELLWDSSSIQLLFLPADASSECR
jgi:hypothetical protein